MRKSCYSILFRERDDELILRAFVVGPGTYTADNLSWLQIFRKPWKSLAKGI